MEVRIGSTRVYYHFSDCGGGSTSVCCVECAVIFSVLQAFGHKSVLYFLKKDKMFTFIYDWLHFDGKLVCEMRRLSKVMVVYFVHTFEGI